jgi:hypothetical protein
VSDRILNLTQLEALYDEPSRNSLVKVARHITPEYGAWIGLRRNMALGSGPRGFVY